ncbi:MULTISPECIES: hypothetical protein [Piscinibacter]|nr:MULTISPECIES: hypothetical protein [Piscinibacter]
MQINDLHESDSTMTMPLARQALWRVLVEFSIRAVAGPAHG